MLKFYYRKGLFNSTEYIQLLAELETELEKVWKEGNNNAK